MVLSRLRQGKQLVLRHAFFSPLTHLYTFTISGDMMAVVKEVENDRGMRGERVGGGGKSGTTLFTLDFNP
jgi:hypothetical protein